MKKYIKNLENIWSIIELEDGDEQPRLTLDE